MTNNNSPQYTMVYEHTFNGMRYSDNILRTTLWTLKLSMNGPRIEEEFSEYQVKKTSVAYQKILFFMDAVLDDCILCTICELSDLNNLYNTKIVLPDGEASDEIFLQTLHAKFTVIVGNDLLIDSITLHSTDTNILYEYHFQGVYDLPDQDNYVGENPLYADPWWHRSDVDTFDVSQDNEHSESILENKNVMKKFEEQAMKYMFEDDDVDDDDTTIEKKAADIITIDNWQKPRKV